MLGVCILFPFLRAVAIWLALVGLPLHVEDKQGLVIHLGWSQCLGLTITIMMPIYTKNPATAKGMAYYKNQKKTF